MVFSTNISFQTWQLIGQQLLAIADSSAWWIADWLAYGEANYQDRYRDALQATSLSYQTLRNYAWVARHIDMSRRREALSFGHHAEVAALDPPEQDFWLRKAEELTWSRNHLRRQVRSSLRERQADEGRPGEAAPPGPPDESVGAGAGTGPAEADDNRTLALRLTEEQYEQFIVAASNRQLRLEEWVMDVLAVAATYPDLIAA